MQPVDLTKVNAAISRELAEKTNEVARLRKALRPFIRYAQLHGSMDLVGRNKSSLSRNDWEAAIEAYYASAPEESYYPEQDLPTPDEEIAYAKANKKQMSWKQYKRKGLSEMRPYIQGEVLPPCVSISEADLKNGSPKVGDMIARNPKNHDDQWLVAEKYFNDNLELAPAPEESVTQKGSPNKETPLGTTLRSEEYVLAGDKNLEGEFNIVKEPTPEWRELGPDEVIQMDDMYRNDVSSRNYPVTSVMIGNPVGNFPFPEYSFRTRRPLPDPVPTQQPTQNEWRELGKDEVICEGDEEMHRDGWIWFPVATPDIGLTPSDHRNYSFRTRRPLPDPVPTQQPTQNEWRELGKDEEICEGDEGNQKGTDVWGAAGCAFWGMKPRHWRSYRFRTRRPLPKQEGPLDVIEKSALEMLSHENVFTCLRYLRDEIEQLKKNQK